MRKIGEKGLELIKKFEGLKLTAYKPLPTEKYWTIGYGHYGPDVLAGMQITEISAEIMLENDLADCYDCIEAYVDVDLTQGQYDALCSFIFNLGCNAFKNSTLLRLLNQGNTDGARKQFPRWVHAGGKKLEGLVRRRLEEARLFDAGDYVSDKDSSGGGVRSDYSATGSCDDPT